MRVHVNKWSFGVSFDTDHGELLKELLHDAFLGSWSMLWAGQLFLNLSCTVLRERKTFIFEGEG
jgi:hypothetical protein